MAFSLAFNAPAEKASRAAMVSTAGGQSGSRIENSAKLSERAWLRAIKLASPHSDILSVYGARIFLTSSGRYYILSSRDRREIAALQDNSDIAVRVLAAAALELKARLKRETGLEPTRGALLVAYFYGRKAAGAYMRALDRGGEQTVLRAVPELAKALAGKKGTTVAGLEEQLSRAFETISPATADAAGAAGAPDHRDIRGTVSESLDRSDAGVRTADKIAAH